jgi:hypothetical protein
MVLIVCSDFKSVVKLDSIFTCIIFGNQWLQCNGIRLLDFLLICSIFLVIRLLAYFLIFLLLSNLNMLH